MTEFIYSLLKRMINFCISPQRTFDMYDFLRKYTQYDKNDIYSIGEYRFETIDDQFITNCNTFVKITPLGIDALSEYEQYYNEKQEQKIDEKHRFKRDLFLCIISSVITVILTLFIEHFDNIISFINDIH